MPNQAFDTMSTLFSLKLVSIYLKMCSQLLDDLDDQYNLFLHKYIFVVVDSEAPCGFKVFNGFKLSLIVENFGFNHFIADILC